jgi:hypothetical protein
MDTNKVAAMMVVFERGASKADEGRQQTRGRCLRQVKASARSLG